MTVSKTIPVDPDWRRTTENGTDSIPFMDMVGTQRAGDHAFSLLDQRAHAAMNLCRVTVSPHPRQFLPAQV